MLSGKIRPLFILVPLLAILAVGCSGPADETGTTDPQLSAVTNSGAVESDQAKAGNELGTYTEADEAVEPVDTPEAPRPVLLEEYEHQYEREIEIFEEQEAENPSPKGGIVFTGSSSIRMWKTLEEDMAPLPAINRGFGGSTLRQVNAYSERIIFPLEPSLIVLYCGENDIAMAGQTPEETHQDFLDLVELYRYRMPETPILFVSMKPSIARWKYWDQFEAGNKTMKAICDQEDYLTFIDVGPAMLGENGEPRPEIFIKDKLHMNALGYEDWTRLVRKEVEAHFEPAGTY